MKITDILLENSKPPLIVSIINQRIKKGEKVYIDVGVHSFTKLKGLITQEIYPVQALNLFGNSRHDDWEVFYKDENTGARKRAVLTGDGSENFYTLKTIKVDGETRVTLVSKQNKQEPEEDKLREEQAEQQKPPLIWTLVDNQLKKGNAVYFSLNYLGRETKGIVSDARVGMKDTDGVIKVWLLRLSKRQGVGWKHYHDMYFNERSADRYTLRKTKKGLELQEK